MHVALRVFTSPLRRASRGSESTGKAKQSKAKQSKAAEVCLNVLALAFSVAVAQPLIFSAFKASRAPQAEMAEEARVFERSEFPRRAISDEEHRAPMRSIGECQALAVLLPFAKTKGRRAA
ncbi:hypothetical protein [Pseudoxanthomonas sp. GM95]|uniref:hypothetical protein n=1 Tax=Pseudoxanthomonas sp. GM95 TaxID=1881043 RepID=UPI001113A892|nr:hypothetical protein [Pseudoxanthomonas sp. GM95]